MNMDELREAIYVEDDRNGGVDRTLDLIYDHFDHCFLCRQFHEVDSFLHEVQVDRVCSDVLIAILTASLPAKQKLTNRADFLSLVRPTLIGRHGRAATQVLLRGLE